MNLPRQPGRRRDKPKRAGSSARRKVARRPSSPIALLSRGVELKDQRRYEEAERCIRRALALDPGSTEAEVALGHTLFLQGAYSQAVDRFRRALAIKPGLAQAHYRLGNALTQQGQITEAEECYRRAIALKPDYSVAYANLAFTMNYDAEASPAELYAAHRAWAALFPQTLDRTYANDRRPERRLRIGYVSGDFREHAVAYFFEPLLASHNHSEVEVFCYSSLDEADEDSTTARLKSLAEHWISILRQDDKNVAKRIRADRIDILVDLGGYTTASRITVFAMKPAPVQATWLGYLNTTGLATIEYRMSDAIVDPEGEADQFNSETLVRLRPPFLCFRPFDQAPHVSVLPARRSGHLTFGSFNNLPKLTPGVIKLWATLLHSVPESRLLIKTEQMSDAPTAKKLRSRFADEGIAPNRIAVLGSQVSTADHLSRYSLVDIALDSFPFNGVTTTCEALWMGVPVVTLPGDRPYGRVGTSLLASTGLQEFVVGTPEAYVEKAANLGADLSRLSELRSGLRDRIRSSPLCDGAGFARAIEQAYRRMWEGWCFNQPKKSWGMAGSLSSPHLFSTPD
jgi:protein O-GlcNAc transferase